MDLSTSLALLNMITFNIPIVPTAAEMETRYESEKRLKMDLFRNYDGSMPSNKNGPVKIIPILTVDHIRAVDEDQGSLTISMTFVFTWMDERLMWNVSAYGGIPSFTRSKFELMVGYNLWVPTLHMTDLPGSAKQSDLLMNHDIDMFIHNSGTVRATVKALVSTPCYFGFGDYPNDYQNCSFTLMTPYYADEMQFADWGGVELSFFMMSNKRVSDVQDFQLIDIDSQNYYMYLGLKIVQDLTLYKVQHCRSYFRYNMMLKRVNRLLFAQLSVPMMVICVLIGLSGLVPSKYSLALLVFSVGVQLMNIVNMSEILPDDYNGMPTIAVLAMFIMIETLGLIVWRTFSIFIKGEIFSEDLDDMESQKNEEEIEARSKILKIVFAVDDVIKYVLFLQGIGNFYIILKNA